MSTNKKNVIIILVSMLLLILVGFGLYYFYVNNLYSLNNLFSNQNSKNDKPLSMEDVTKNNNIFLNSAMENLDASYCQKIDNKAILISSCEKSVLEKKSLVKKDSSFCQESKDVNVVKDCQSNFWFWSMLEGGDISLCDNIPDEQAKNNCHDIALYGRDFQKNKASFDCKKFYEPDAAADCVYYKANQKKPADTLCQNLHSSLFQGAYCSLNQIAPENSLQPANSTTK